MGDIIQFNKKRYKGDKFMNNGKINNIKDIDISKSQKIRIESIVKTIISETDFTESPSVDIVSLVKQADFVVQTSEMDINTTGCLIVNDLEHVMDTNKHRLIVVNENFRNDNNDDNFKLKKSRFITAHEYGHFVLHKKQGQPIYAHRDTYHRTDPLELEADYFARSILMPYDIFNSYFNAIKKLGITDKNKIIVILSTIFKTTKDKVTKRLNDIDELQGCL